ncbi:MAG: hypothetical protein ACRDHP_10175 [Ktedonobacterales bacterium]
MLATCMGLEYLDVNPAACWPYIEQFARHAGCREVTLDVDPFDVRWSVVRRVIALLEEREAVR